MAEWHILLHDRIIKRFWLDEGMRMTLGRGGAVDIDLDNSAISRRHAVIERNQGVFFITDLNSTNGTKINGQRISGRVAVGTQDHIEMAKFRLVPAMGEDKHPVSLTAADFEGTVMVSNRKEAVGTGKGLCLTIVKGQAVPMRLRLDNTATVSLGKDRNCDMRVSGWFVAAKQCYISLRNGKYYVVPRYRWRRTKLNGRHIRKAMPYARGIP